MRGGRKGQEERAENSKCLFPRGISARRLPIVPAVSQRSLRSVKFSAGYEPTSDATFARKAYGESSTECNKRLISCKVFRMNCSVLRRCIWHRNE